jgi:hypothetical protein
LQVLIAPDSLDAVSQKCLPLPLVEEFVVRMLDQTDVEAVVMSALSSNRVRTDQGAEDLLVIGMNEYAGFRPAGFRLNDGHETSLAQGVACLHACGSHMRHAEKQQGTCHFEIGQIEAVVVSSAPAVTG